MKQVLQKIVQKLSARALSASANQAPSEEELLRQDTLRRQAIVILGVLAVIIFFLGVYGDAMNPLWSYDRTALNGGEWWRILTGNFVHLSVNHMLMNLSVYILAVLVFQKEISPVFWNISLFICALGVGLGLWFIDTNISNYVGLSGALYGMIILGTLTHLRENIFLFLCVYAYVMYKIITQQLPNYNPAEMKDFIGGNVVASSHLFGMIAGHLCACVFYIKQYTSRS